MNPPSEPWQEAENEIVAYIMGDMTPEKAAEFERRLQSNEQLRLQVQQWQSTVDDLKEWADSDAPGVERVESFPIPVVSPARTRHVPPLRLPETRKSFTAWRWVGVAAVFVIGFFAGSLTQRKPPGLGQGITPPSPEVTAPQTAIESQTITQPELAVPTPSAPAQLANLPSGQEDEAAVIRPARYTSEENGRLTIETTLKRSGARALWVVDGSFALTPDKGASS